MVTSADVLIANLATFGALLLVLSVGGFVASLVALRAIAAVLRSVDVSGELHARWARRLARLFVLAWLLIALGSLAGAVLFTHHEIDATSYVLRWVDESLLADPSRAAWTAVQLLGVLLGALCAYFLLRSVLTGAIEVLARTAALAGHRPGLDRLFARARWTLCCVCLFAALLLAARVLTGSEAAPYLLAVLTYVVVAVSLSRSVVAAAHLTIDLAFDMSGAPAGKPRPLRYLARLQRLAGVTRRVADYFIYVGAATVVSHQLAPETLLGRWGELAIRVIAILYISRVLVEVVELMLRDALGTRASSASEHERQQRQTLVPAATSLTRYTIYIFSVSMALSEIGLDTTPLFAAAGLMGIAVGLGAQAIVSDLVSGFFVLFEGIFLVGHRVKIGDYIGIVEELGVRVTKVRDDFGVLHTIPNGEIRCVSSYSQRYVNAIVEFAVPHEEELARVFAVVKACVERVRGERPEILDETQIVVQELREAALWIRTTTRVAPGQDDPICEALRFEIAAALAAAGIRPPLAYHVVRLTSERPVTKESVR